MCELVQTAATLEQHLGTDPKLYKTATMFAFGYRATDPDFRKTRQSIEDTVSRF